MRIAIFSDVHANLEALTAFVEHSRSQAIDVNVCLGDVVGYGADPNACCQIVRELAAVSLLGNHDAAVIGVMDTDFYYPAAKEALFWTRRNLSEENFRWLYSLPYTHRIDGVGFYHAAPVLPSGFYYVVREDDAKAHVRMFERLDPFTFVGHSHLTSQYRLTARVAKDVSGRKITGSPSPDAKYLINVGSIGQPRDHDARACYGLFDTVAGTFEHVRLDYDVEKTSRKIRDAGLEAKFADRLFTGT
jgi:diadenosine tetraphosphatase ApaH/serine/threonine PP2A family protein phosphatase